MKISTIEEAIDDIKKGKIVIVVDDEDRENEGDFVMAAEHCTPEKINFMITNGRGLLCVPMKEERMNRLGIHPMTSTNT
ncbi:MAG: 3,4-dihydroxy-2-butanone-4-phosphate synthase, partial [Candidatus Methanofastidiosia archaeon]